MSLDTLTYVRQLEAAGVPRAQAEAHASALREHLETEVVTHADLGAAVDRLEARIDRLEARIDKLELKIDAAEKRLDVRIDSVEKHLDAKLDAHLQRIESTIWKVGFAVLGGVLAIGGLLLRIGR